MHFLFYFVWIKAFKREKKGDALLCASDLSFPDVYCMGQNFIRNPFVITVVGKSNINTV